MANVDLFKNAEEQFFRLKGQLGVGRITRAQFEDALKELMVQDAQGRYWMLYTDSGVWHMYDGQKWIAATPPTSTPVTPTTLPERVAPVVPTTLPERVAPAVPSTLPAGTPP